MALPGFRKPCQAVISLKFMNVGTLQAQQIAVLLALWNEGSFWSGRRTLRDRMARRRGEAARPVVLAGMGLSGGGLESLCPALLSGMPSPAFQVGMARRAGLLGDARTPGQGAVATTPDVLLVLAGDDPRAVNQLACQWAQRLKVGRQVKVHVQPGCGLGERRNREHFGFVDGISQPGIRGRYNHWPASYITPRRLPPDDPEHDLFGWPGQHLVWPGEFVLGYPASSPDPRIPGPVRPVPSWMHNGSFLVYRRLRQDVAGFRIWLHEQAAALADFPGFEGLSRQQAADRLAAKLVGRWPSGAPLSRAPDHDIPALGRDPMRNNDFRFDDDAASRAHPERELPPLPHAVADSLGARCPVGAHIRKVNVRDQASDIGGTSATYARRILRVGVPYGKPLPDNFTAEEAAADRGLLFLSIQASIEDQFEFLQARWMNSGSRPRAPGGHDMLVGQVAGERRCPLFSPDLRQSAEVRSTRSFVTMTGGGYFFVPSLSTLRWLLTSGSVPP